ncbi:NAD/NADP octopine/nopaline dehydrogenase family protein [Sinorhizobium meliloti]|uniref:NAD/NADP octopine/nopaline dehydrogenase family protein n=1 Tax=Rhizobium meliloti TaxID=382 RepID=UPI0020909359|nr:NAD/NADP octopine/nopaline dehydrogenase family protein [Sinorhizobium meliloti]MCO5966585.1 NAD/NADP octopine/nopaline dehydrogenase family protein [Sinorhizobium meliloti]
MRVTICGAGRTGHLNAVLFKQRPGIEVSVLTSSSKVAETWAGGDGLWHAHTPDNQTLSARPDHVGTDPRTALEGADVVVITQPAQARPALLSRIAPHLPRDRNVYVGAIPGFCGFDWLAARSLAGRDNVVIWGMKDVPHTAFDLVSGQRVRMGGGKAELFAALHRRESAESAAALGAMLNRLYDAPVTMLEDYLEITLTPGNPLMHPAVLYALIGPGAPFENKPFDEPICWWSDCSLAGAELLEALDAENQAIRRASEARLGLDLSSVKPLRQELIEAYGEQIEDDSTMYSLLRTNRAYAGILAPLVPNPGGPGLVIDRESRAFHEDIAFGQALLVSMADRLEIAVPTISKTYNWARDYHGHLAGGAPDYVPTAWPEAQ